MTCFTPNQGYQKVLPSGKYNFTYDRKKARRVNGVPQKMDVPCRRCEGCRFSYSREWSIKIIHEAQMYLTPSCDNTSFITLTYDDNFIPMYGALSYDDHWTNFMKRLRKVVPVPIRFYMVGEYGDLNLRPHYHAIIFGWSFPDKYEHEVRNGNRLYRSSLLESVWTVPRGEEFSGMSYGYSSVGSVTVESAAYVARYNMKKQIGKDECLDYDRQMGLYIPSRYERLTPEGEVIFVPPEKARMSNGGGSGEGGIGKRWFDEYGIHDLYSKGKCHLPNGAEFYGTKYYDKLLERVNPDLLEQVKLSRQDFLSSHANDFTADRLRQRRECLLQRLSKKTRNIRRVYGAS